jgi:hypothetical protein
MSKRASCHATRPASACPTDQTKLNAFLRRANHFVSSASVPFRDSQTGFEPRIRIFVPRRGPAAARLMAGGTFLSSTKRKPPMSAVLGQVPFFTVVGRAISRSQQQGSWF